MRVKHAIATLGARDTGWLRSSKPVLRLLAVNLAIGAIAAVLMRAGLV